MLIIPAAKLVEGKLLLSAIADGLLAGLGATSQKPALITAKKEKETKFSDIFCLA